MLSTYPSDGSTSKRFQRTCGMKKADAVDAVVATAMVDVKQLLPVLFESLKSQSSRGEKCLMSVDAAIFHHVHPKTLPQPQRAHCPLEMSIYSFPYNHLCRRWHSSRTKPYDDGANAINSENFSPSRHTNGQAAFRGYPSSVPAPVMAGMVTTED